MNDRVFAGGERYGNSIMLRPDEMTNEAIIQEAIRELRISTGNMLAELLQEEKPYIVRLTTQQGRDMYPHPEYRVMAYLDVKEVPVEEIQVYREWRVVEVDAASLHIEAINCKNCAAPIPVGRLDRHGDTLVRCSYCGTYHTIRKRGNTDG